MFPISDIFLFHVTYKACYLSVIKSVVIKVKGNVLIIEHLHKIGIETIFTITVQGRSMQFSWSTHERPIAKRARSKNRMQMIIPPRGPDNISVF